MMRTKPEARANGRSTNARDRRDARMTAVTKRMPSSSNDPIDWSGVRLETIELAPSTIIFSQGDAATSVMFVERGDVRLSVVSHTGKEAVIAVLGARTFLGEGCLARQPKRMATATAIAPCAILSIEKDEMKRQLRSQPAFADRFLAHMLTRNIRIEEDLVDQLFNSGEKRLARPDAPPVGSSLT
jgi:CRP-like cAMP-binding protein